MKTRSKSKRAIPHRGDSNANAVRIILGVLLWISCLKLPYMALNSNADWSQQSLYYYATFHGWKYGIDFIYNAGPLGFIVYSPLYAGCLFWQTFWAQLLLQAGLVTLILLIGKSYKHRFMEALLYGAFFFAQTGSPAEDLNYEWAILLAALLLMRLKKPSGVIVAAFSAWCGFFLLTKQNFAILAVLAPLFVGAGMLLRRSFASVAVLCGSYLVALASWWLVSGQRFASIGTYFYNSMKVTPGYSVMAVYEPVELTLLGLAGVALCGSVLVAGAICHRRSGNILLMQALLACELFFTWKHGYIRADEHTLIFFVAIVLFVLIAFWVNDQPKRAATILDASRWRGWPLLAKGIEILEKVECLPAVRIGTVVVTLCLAVWGLSFYYPGNAITWANGTFSKLLSNAGDLVSPQGLKARLDADLVPNRQSYSLPELRAKVGAASVDVWGYQHAVALLNGMNLTCRPVAPLVAYSPHLLELNQKCYAGPEAPEYIMAALQPLDFRLATMEDSLAFREILDRYSPVASEANFLLFAKRNDGGLLVREKMQEDSRVVLFDHPVGVTQGEKEVVFARVGIKTSILGKAISFLYKPPQLNLVVRTRHGVSRAFRVMTENVGAGFLLSPLVPDIQRLGELLTGGEGDPVNTISISTQKGWEWAYRPEIELVLQRIPMRGAFASKDALRGLYPGYNTVPSQLITPRISQPSAQSRINLFELPTMLALDVEPGTWRVVASVAIARCFSNKPPEFHADLRVLSGSELATAHLEGNAPMTLERNAFQGGPWGVQTGCLKFDSPRKLFIVVDSKDPGQGGIVSFQKLRIEPVKPN